FVCRRSAMTKKQSETLVRIAGVVRGNANGFGIHALLRAPARFLSVRQPQAAMSDAMTGNPGSCRLRAGRPGCFPGRTPHSTLSPRGRGCSEGSRPAVAIIAAAAIQSGWSRPRERFLERWPLYAGRKSLEAFRVSARATAQLHGDLAT